MTKNHNESFNRVTWDRIPKTTYVGRDVIELGVYDAVCHFNDGEAATLQVLQHLGLESEHLSDKFCNELDNSRIYSSQ